MAEAFSAFRYISYIRSRWRFIALSCVVAVTIAAVVSLTQPREYTAAARIVIDPPAGSDPRASIAVSPIYLESLKTYEAFATSDSLFRKALDRFNLRSTFGARPIESVKKRVLRAGVVRNTRILEISATLPDARNAQALASFLAESTVEINRVLATEGDQDLVRGVEQQARDARAQMDQVEALWTQLLSREPVDSLNLSTAAASDLRGKLQEQLLAAELDSGGAVRAEALRKQIESLDSQAAAREKLLASRLAHREKLDAEREERQDALQAVETRLREARGNAGYRGERLKMIDPGIVPESPSSPNVPLNLAAALLLGVVLPLLYLAVEMNFQEQRIRDRRKLPYASEGTR